MAIFPYTKEFKSAIREEDIMDYVLKQHILRRMLLEMRLGERILDLVINLFFLDQANFTFAGSYCVPCTGITTRSEDMKLVS